MPSNELPTTKHLRVPVVLVVGGTPMLSAVVQEAALAAQVLMSSCSVAEVTTVAAEIRPLVMVVSEAVFTFDPDSFYALARDVHSQVLTVSERELDVDGLANKLKALLAEADEYGPGWGGEPGQR